MSQENETTRRSRARQTEDVMIKEPISPTTKSVAVADPMANILSTLMNCDAAQLRVIFDTTIKEHNRKVGEERDAYDKEIDSANEVSKKAQVEIDKLYARIEELSEVVSAQRDRQEQAANDHAANMGALEEAQIRIKNVMSLFASQLDNFAI